MLEWYDTFNNNAGILNIGHTNFNTTDLFSLSWYCSQEPNIMAIAVDLM